MQFPTSDRTPLIRTDFSHDEAWRRVVAAASSASADGFQANLHVVDDDSFAGADPVAIAEAANRSSDFALLIIADSATMSDSEMPLLCLEPSSPGERLRVVPAEVWAVENNLSLANMDFAEFAAAADPDGVFRGFGG